MEFRSPKFLPGLPEVSQHDLLPPIHGATNAATDSRWRDRLHRRSMWRQEFYGGPGQNFLFFVTHEVASHSLHQPMNGNTVRLYVGQRITTQHGQSVV